MDRCDAVILAGGRATPDMTELAGTHLRALFPWKGKPFVLHAFEALRACSHIERITIIGPADLAGVAGLTPDILLLERDTITDNLFAAVDALNSQTRIMVTACDNPLLSTEAFNDFLSRIPPDAAVAYPILPHADFLARFPGAANIPVKLRDGVWIGGGCVVIAADAVPKVRQTLLRVLTARKSLWPMVALLGPWFALRFALKRVDVDDVERRASRLIEMPFRFVPNSSPVFAIDVDDPEDWVFLQQWASVQKPA